MPGNTFGQLFRITTWGESHGPSIGVVVDGCPAGLPLSEKDIQVELDRRRTGQSKVTTTRKEPDQIRFLSGIFNGKTTGTPLAMMVENSDADSSKYELIKHLYRPGHADFTYDQKYGFRDYRGGGRSSARETVGRVAAGACRQKASGPATKSKCSPLPGKSEIWSRKRSARRKLKKISSVARTKKWRNKW